MITDHGVRTLYMDNLKKGYYLEREGNFDGALSRYEYALEIATQFEDSGCINECNKIIAHAKTLKQNDEKTF